MVKELTKRPIIEVQQLVIIDATSCVVVPEAWFGKIHAFVTAVECEASNCGYKASDVARGGVPVLINW